MDDSCTRIDSARFNVINNTYTVVDFQVGNLNPALTGCTSDTGMTFRVVLQPNVVTELKSNNGAVKPNSVQYR